MIRLFWLFLITALEFAIMFVLPYLLFWKFKPNLFYKSKIQKVQRQVPQIDLELKYSFLTLVIRSSLFLIMWSLAEVGLLRLNLSFHFLNWQTELLAFVAYFVIYDTYFYWSHRLLHVGWLYRKVHVIHHKSLNPNPLTSFSFHPLESVISLLYIFVYLALFDVSLPMFLVLMFITDVGNLVGHLGYEIFPRRTVSSWWGKWITTPTHHNLHHQLSKCNYGLYWNGWDLLWNTQHPRTENEFIRVKSGQ